MKKIELHRANEFKSLKYLIGEPLNYISGLSSKSLISPPDGEVKIVADYSKTVLVDFEFIESLKPQPPRHVHFLVSKSALCCGDFLLQRKSNADFIINDYISDLIEPAYRIPQNSVQYSVL